MNYINEQESKLLQDADANHFRHPFTDHKDLSQKKSRIITHAEGVYIYDAQKNKILDGMSGLWCVNVGYGRKELAKAAYDQMQDLPYYNTFFQCTHPPAVKLAQTLVEITPAHMNQVFFTGSGSECNETVIRTVRYFWKLQGFKDKNVIIARDNAYHGSGVGSASLGGMTVMHEQGDLPIPNIEHIEQPYYYGEGKKTGLSEEEFGLKAAQALEKKILELGEDRVAAFIAEPIQGAGGVIIPPKSYWPEVQKICNKYNILFVLDEVISGFGRLGTWFAADFYDLKPDLMCMAKGMSSGYLPIGGVMMSDRVSEVLTEKGGEFFHGFTYSGHPAACAVALANINILKNENVLETLRETTIPYMREKWMSLADHPLVEEVRIEGMLGALELNDLGQDDIGTLTRDQSIENGLVMRATGDTMLIAPPLVIEPHQIDELVEKARKTFDDIYEKYAQ